MNSKNEFKALVKKDKKANACIQRAVWRQSGCLLADSVVVIWKLTTRRSLSEPPPERQAARTLPASLRTVRGGHEQKN